MYEENSIEDWAPWAAVVLTVIGGALRFLFLDVKGLGLDETLSIWVSSHNVPDLLHWVATIDQHPPLYYLLLHYWTAFLGNSSYNIRMLSVLLGAATIPFIYLIGKRISNEVVGLVAAAILTFSPFNIRYSQETRMYTLLTFTAAVAIYALVRLLTDKRASTPIGSQFREYLHTWRTPSPIEPGVEESFSYEDKSRNQTGWRAWIYRHRWLSIHSIETDLAWVVFIVFSAATLYTHNSAILFPIATNIFVLGLLLFQRLKQPGSPPAFQPPSFLNWVKAQVGIIILWSPWIYAFIQQARRVYQEFWIATPGWDTVLQALKTLLNETIPGKSSPLMIAWILYALALCLGLVYYRKNISRFLFLASLVTIPIIGELIVSIRRPVFLDRTLIWTTIPLFLLLAAGIAQLRFRFLIVIVMGILITNNLFSTGDYYRFFQKEDWNNPAGFVANFSHQDDLILFNATKAQIPFDYYFTYYEDLYSLQVDKHGVPSDLFESGVLEPKMTESDIPRLLSLIEGRKVVWLVYRQDQNTDPQGLIPQTLASKMKLIVARDYIGSQVQLYIAP